MTTSPETDNLNHPVLRRLVDEADGLSLADRLTLLKGLIPSIARDMTPQEYDQFLSELRLKGERFHEAVAQPGQGRADRTVMGERDIEGR